MHESQGNRFILALGGNATADVTSNAQTLGNAVEQIKAGVLSQVEISRFYRTPAYPPGAGPDFVNACLTGYSDAAPTEVLAALHAIEAEMGRVRVQRWGQRVIDLDLLAMGATILPDRDTLAQWVALPPEAQALEAPQTLILPHPRLHQRAFVLVPMADVAPDWVHPLLGLDVLQMLAALPQAEIAAIRAI